MQGKVIGIHSRIGPDITANIHVPVNTYRDTWDRLVKGESWGGRLGSTSRPAGSPYLGVSFARPGDNLKVIAVTEGGPAYKAGIKVGDTILSIDGSSFQTRFDLLAFLDRKKAGDTIVVAMQRDDEEVKVKLTLGKRPAE
jgi:serine protease Do